jgi:hypothetical protein
MRTYYTLAIQWDKGDRYSPEFGDYNLECVNDERDDILYSYDLKGSQIKVIKTDGNQSSIDQAIHNLNATLKGIKL